MDREHKVKIEKFHRPTNIGFLGRLDRILNLAGLARMIKTCKHKQTFTGRINRHTDLTRTVEQKAFAEETGEILNEAWYIIGVALGKFPRDPHKKFRYFYNDETDRLKDTLEELEERSES